MESNAPMTLIIKRKNKEAGRKNDSYVPSIIARCRACSESPRVDIDEVEAALKNGLLAVRC
jgi:predicted RNA-binding protein associated with RNAse of E/G family